MKRVMPLFILLVLTSACGHKPEAATDVDLAEFSVSPDAKVLQAGNVSFHIENDGEFAHTLVVSDLSGTVLSASDLIDPDTEAELTVDLAPGSYVLTCRIVIGLDDGTVIDHYQEGMVATVRAVAPAA